MVKHSSKFFNMMALAELINIDTQTNGVLLITSAGRFVGNLLTLNNFNDSKYNSLAYNVTKGTDILIKTNKSADQEFELIDDGFFITLKDARFISNENKAILSINQINIYCSEIIAFSPVNISEYLQQVC